LPIIESDFGKRVKLEGVFDEFRIGGDATYQHRFGDIFRINTGLRYTSTEVDPIFDAEFQVPKDPKKPNKLTPIAAFDTQDELFGAFTEGRLCLPVYGNIKADLLGGVRADHNNLRDKGWGIIPRGALLFYTEQWTIKGSYNSGYVRPSLFMSLGTGDDIVNDQGVHLIGANRSEKIAQIDAQAIYQGENFKVAVAYYQLQLEGLLSHVSVEEVVVNKVKYDANFLNLNSITTNGIEMECMYQPIPLLMLYGNGSYVISAGTESLDWKVATDFAEFAGKQENSTLFDEDKQLAHMPRLIANAGATLRLPIGLTFNAHLRYWDMLKYVSREKVPNSIKQITVWKDLPAGWALDANLGYTIEIAKMLDIEASVFCKNIIDKENLIGLSSVHGAYSDYRRSIGGKLLLRF
jgi:outer membrane receptor for ferrienterochelin and colicin